MCIFQCMGHDEQTVVAFSDPWRINFSNELKLLCRSKLSSIIISDFLSEVLSYIHKHLSILIGMWTLLRHKVLLG